MSDLLVVGSVVSPYVRKVLVVMCYKQLPFEIDPIVPFYGNDEFTRLSPLRRIPVLIDRRKDLVVNDSSVILEYLEERYPQKPLYPAVPEQRARVRWLEEFADSRMGDVFIWEIFNQNIRRWVWDLDVDRQTLDRALSVDLPHIMDYLETQAPAEGYLAGEYSVADIAVAAFFRNLAFARVEVDSVRWPLATGLVARVLARDEFKWLATFEDMSLRVPPHQVRQVLADTALCISQQSYGAEIPRSGPMTQF